MSERCATCGAPLAERSAGSPAERYCQDDWYREQLRRFDAGDLADGWLAEWFTRPRTPETRAQWLGARA